MIGDRKGSHFTTRDLKSIGFDFCDTLLDYCDPDPTKVGLKQDLYCCIQFKGRNGCFIYGFPLISDQILSGRT